MEPSHTNSPRAPLIPDRLQPVLWQGRVGPAFWTVASAISLLVNIILIVVLMIMGRQLFQIKQVLSNQLVGGLYTNFIKMDEARIQTNIKVNSTIPVDFDLPVNFTLPVQFDLPVKTNTTVTLTKNTPINNARVSLFGGVLTIDNAPTDIVLPAGTRLPIALDIVVPVNTTVPVNTVVPVHTTVPVQLNVPVDIPLKETELHEPFVGLQQVVSPYNTLLNSSPSSWQEALCPDPADQLCRNLIK
ncbi:MAG TPA: hypothetical protein VMT46_06915 [Anaerolineaceae bacterium]|nr:hypothetical protein [Anaerolineaceae bacterium]